MIDTTNPDCPPWCIGGHAPRAAHTSRPEALFNVVSTLRVYRGNATANLSLDAERKTGGIDLDADELDRVIGLLTKHLSRLRRATA